MPTPEEPKADPLAASVAAAIGKLRRDAGLSERAAAKKLGTSQTQLRRMEDPRYLPSLRSLSRVANAYGARLVVTFETGDERANERPTPARMSAPAKPAVATKPAASKPARAATRGSSSPSKARRASPGRGRAAARRAPRRAAPRRKAR